MYAGSGTIFARPFATRNTPPGRIKKFPPPAERLYRRQPFAVFDIQPQRRVGFIVNAAVHRHLHPAVAINTRQQRTQGTPGFAVPIPASTSQCALSRIHPIALQGQRRVGEGTGGAGDGGQGQQRQGSRQRNNMGSPFYGLRRVYPPRCLMPPKSHSVFAPGRKANRRWR